MSKVRRKGEGGGDGHVSSYRHSSYTYTCTCMLSSTAGVMLLYLLQNQEPVKEHTIKGHSEGIAMLAWSPDDTMLLSCGKEDNQEALVYSTEVRSVVIKLGIHKLFSIETYTNVSLMYKHVGLSPSPSLSFSLQNNYMYMYTYVTLPFALDYPGCKYLRRY